MPRSRTPQTDTSDAPLELSGSLLKGLALLDGLARSEKPLGVTQIANQLAIGKSGVHRLLQVMKNSGWVRQTPEGEYECTLKLWELGLRLIERTDLRRAALPAMRRLADETQETVQLSVLDGPDVLYLEKLDSPQPVAASTRIGGRAAAHCVATGRALLAYQSETVIFEATENMEAFTPRTITTREQLHKELQTVKQKGYSVNRGEWRGGVYGLAAPIFDASSQAIAAIGIAAPGNRLTETAIRTYAPLVMEAAKSISRELGSQSR